MALRICAAVAAPFNEAETLSFAFPSAERPGAVAVPLAFNVALVDTSFELLPGTVAEFATPALTVPLVVGMEAPAAVVAAAAVLVTPVVAGLCAAEI